MYLTFNYDKINAYRFDLNRIGLKYIYIYIVRLVRLNES